MNRWFVWKRAIDRFGREIFVSIWHKQPVKLKGLPTFIQIIIRSSWAKVVLVILPLKKRNSEQKSENHFEIMKLITKPFSFFVWICRLSPLNTNLRSGKWISRTKLFRQICEVFANNFDIIRRTFIRIHYAWYIQLWKGYTMHFIVTETFHLASARHTLQKRESLER